MAESADPDDVWTPFGPFSQLVIGGKGRTVHLKGQVALDRDGAVVGPGDMPVQIGQVLDNIRTLLSAVGGRMSDIVSLTQYTTDIAGFMEATDIRRAFFAGPYPVTTTVEVRRLHDDRLLVEISAVAEIPDDRFREPCGARPMHG